MPVTAVSGSPALNVSTVSAAHGTSTCCCTRAITSRAVTRFSCATAEVLHKRATMPASLLVLTKCLSVAICLSSLFIAYIRIGSRVGGLDGPLLWRQPRRKRRANSLIESFTLLKRIFRSVDGLKKLDSDFSGVYDHGVLFHN